MVEIIMKIIKSEALLRVTPPKIKKIKKIRERVGALGVVGSRGNGGARLRRNNRGNKATTWEVCNVLNFNELQKKLAYFLYV